MFAQKTVLKIYLNILIFFESRAGRRLARSCILSYSEHFVLKGDFSESMPDCGHVFEFGQVVSEAAVYESVGRLPVRDGGCF